MAPVSPSPVLTAPCLPSQEGPFGGQGRHLQAGHRADEDLDLPADKLQDGGRERGESSPESVRTPPGDSTWDGADIVSPPRPPPGPAAAPAPAPWRRWWRRPLTNPCPRPSGGRWPAAVKVSNACPGHPTCPELPALPRLIAGPADSGAVIFPPQPLKTASPPLPSSSRPSGSCGPASPACPQVNQPGEGVEARVPLWEPQMEPQIPPDPAAGS